MEMEKYLDKNGKEIKEGMVLKHDDGDVERVYKSEEDDLGFNASNEKFVGFTENNRKLYPLYQFDMREWEIVDK
jgi:hypothetical protein